jgi:hypothetical protein
MATTRRTGSFSGDAVIEHPEAPVTEPPISLSSRSFRDIVGEDEVEAGGFVTTACRTDSSPGETAKEHPEALVTEPPASLSGRGFQDIVREDEVEAGAFMAAAHRTDSSFGGPVKEHHETLATEPPVSLVHLIPPGVTSKKSVNELPPKPRVTDCSLVTMRPSTAALIQISDRTIRSGDGVAGLVELVVAART